MVTIKKYLTIIILLAIMVIFSSCWDRKELDELTIVTGIGIDSGADPGEFELTAQYIAPGNVSTPGAGGGQGDPFAVVQGTGETVFDAVRSLTYKIDRKLYFAHNPILIISRDIAEKGVFKYLDFHFRDPEHRRNGWMLVSKDKASDVLKVKTTLDLIPGIYIGKLVEEYGTNSKVSIINEQEFLERIMSKTTAPFATLIEVKGEKDKKYVELTGTAVFKDDKLVGELNHKESRGLMWVLSKVKSGIIVVNCPDAGGKAGLEIIRANSKVTPEVKDNNLFIKVKITEEGHLGDQECPQDLTEPKAWAALEKAQNNVIRTEILAAVKKAQEYNADIFGFGAAIHRKYPRLWKEDLKDKWDEFFPDLEVVVQVESKLRRSGMITKPAVPQD